MSGPTRGVGCGGKVSVRTQPDIHFLSSPPPPLPLHPLKTSPLPPPPLAVSMPFTVAKLILPAPPHSEYPSFNLNVTEDTRTPPPPPPPLLTGAERGRVQVSTLLTPPFSPSLENHSGFCPPPLSLILPVAFPLPSFPPFPILRHHTHTPPPPHLAVR